jgi:hypothetical protein
MCSPSTSGQNSWHQGVMIPLDEWRCELPFFGLTHTQNPFPLWFCWDWAPNSFGAKPPRLVCGHRHFGRVNRHYSEQAWTEPKPTLL